MDRKRIFTLMSIVFSDTCGAAGILVILPLYVVKQFNATPFEAALVIAAYYAAQFIAAPLLGRLSDRNGRRPVLLISQAGTILSYIIFIFAGPLGTLLDSSGFNIGIPGGLLIVYLARILDGITGGNTSVAQAYASDISTNEQRTRALGLVGGANGIGHVVGPAFAGALAGITLVAPFIGAALLSVITLTMSFIWLKETLKVESEPAERINTEEKVPVIKLLSKKPVALILATALLIGLYMAMLSSTLSMYADKVLFQGLPSATIMQIASLIMTGFGVLMAVSQMTLLNPLVRHMGEKRLALFGCILLLASGIIFSLFSSILSIVLFVLAFALGYGLSWPSLQSMLTQTGTEQPGRLLGVYQSVFSLALIIGPVLGGFIFNSVGPQAVFVVCSGFMFLAVILSVGIMHLPVQKFTSQAEMNGGGKHSFRFHH